jgi:predicted nucleic acid-binding Zn ribbon protein
MSKEKDFKKTVEKVVGDIEKKLSKTHGQIQKIWLQITEPNVGRHTKVKEFKEGILYIITDNTAWTHEIIRKKKELISMMQKKTKEEIKDIKTRLGDIK